MQTTHHVHVVSSPGRDLEALRTEMGVETHAVPMTRSISPRQDLVSFFRWLIVMRRVRPEVVVTATPKASLLGQACGLLFGARKRLYYVGGLRFEGDRGAKRVVLQLMEKLTAAFATVVTLNSESAFARAQQLGLYHPRKMAKTVPASSHGVDAVYFSPRSRDPQMAKDLGLDPEVPTFGFVGRLTRDKGIDELIKALHILSDRSFNVLVVGPQNEPDSIRYLEALQRDNRVVCVGRQEDLRPFYAQMDTLLLPSYREGFPNVVMEAAACAVPAIVSDATGAVDSVRHGETGLVTTVKSATELAAAMSAVLENPTEARTMGMRAREWMATEFEPSKVVASLLAPLALGSLASDSRRVAHVINDLRPGGAENLVVQLAYEQRRAGHDARIFTLRGSDSSHLAEEAARREIPVQVLGGHRLSPLAWFRLIRISRGADVVHGHLFPAVWLLAILPRRKTVITEHSPHNRRAESIFGQRLDRKIYRRHGKIAAISDGVEEALRDRVGRDVSVTTVPNGIDLRLVKSAVNAPSPADPLRVIAVGRLDHRKNFSAAIEIMDRVRIPSTLVIVGDGPERDDLTREAVALRGRVQLLGQRNDVLALLARQHVFLSTSAYEGFGIAALEAMAAGLPVVAPRVPGLAEVIGDAGLLFEPGDLDSAAQGLCRLSDPNVWRHYSRAAKTRAQEFSIETTAASYEELYKSNHVVGPAEESR